MKIKWLGWASWLIQSGEKKIAIDPFKGEIDGPVDIILVSHAHLDHCDNNQLSKIRGEKTVVFTPSVYAENINAESLDVGQEKNLNGVKIRGVNAYNLSISNHQKGVDTGYIIEIEGQRIYFAADTDLVEEMKELKDVDLALLPIGGTYTLDLNQAVEAVKIIKPKFVIPMHYGTIEVVLNGELVKINLPANADEFKKMVEESTETKVKVLSPGEETEF